MTGGGFDAPVKPIPFDTTQITSAANYSNPKAGDPCHPLAAGAHAPAVAFQPPELSGTLGGGSGQRGWSNDLDRSGAFIPVNAPVCFYDYLGSQGGGVETGISPTLKRKDGVAATQGAVVRRLTPVECCRLQGFPDDWNAEGIDKSGKRIAMADSSRYRQLGNAVTVNVAERIARRVANVYAAANEVTHVEGNGQEHRREGAEEAEGSEGR